MKKIFVVLMAAGFLVSCNNSADTTDAKKDSLDSIAAEKKDVIDSSADMKKGQIDSLTDAKKETLDRMDSLNRKDTTKK
jgi:hypothetical protein